jgi:uncharacterized membrane protein YuzA (DUF378 family)
MDLVKKLEPLWLVLMMLVALNWAIAALFDTNVISDVLGSGTVRDVFYVVAGVGALTFVPRLVADLHIGDHGAHPRGV